MAVSFMLNEHTGLHDMLSIFGMYKHAPITPFSLICWDKTYIHRFVLSDTNWQTHRSQFNWLNIN